MILNFFLDILLYAITFYCTFCYNLIVAIAVSIISTYASFDYIILLLSIFIIYTIIIWTYVHVCADMSCQITVALRVYIVQSQSATETRRNSILTVSSIKFHYGFAVRKVHSIRVAPSLNFSLVAQQLVKLVKPKDRTGIAQRMTTSSTFMIKIDGMRSKYWTNHKSRLFNCR